MQHLPRFLSAARARPAPLVAAFATVGLLATFGPLGSGGLLAAEHETPPPQAPRVASASDEGAQALRGFKLPPGWQGGLFAAEPDVANPVAFDVDHQGRVWVCETFRQSRGVEDNRGHTNWIDDDLAAQTVADRLRFFQKHLRDKVKDYTLHDDRLRLLVDADGDGRADSAKVFADRFNGVVEGAGAGVLSWGGKVYYTNIPHLWMLADNDHDGVADVRQPLHSGYGVRVAFRGHDMHGLIVGPDGRLYYSIGDRGYHVEFEGKRHADPESGAVFRCELDGSNLEVVATGLRNPQELAFDDHGNLFTGDNNSDSGDKARWVYVVPGGDSGWRMAYQYLSDRGPFNREKLWHPYHPGQPAYIVPPVTNLADGPSGLAFYPGTGLGEHFRDRFLLCDFRGGPANSGVRSFRARPSGAFFEVVDQEQSLWNVLATDVAFAPDGAVLVSDWVNGWNGEGKGRLYRFVDPRAAEAAIVKQTRDLLARGVGERSLSELTALLGHPDRRARMLAQFELVERGASETLVAAARDGDATLPRLHALWGLGQLARRPGGADALRAPLEKLLEVALRGADAETRAHAARLAGEARLESARPRLVELLRDENARVRYHAALSLASFARADSIPHVLELLAANADKDPIVRHGGVLALAAPGDAAALVEAANHPSPAARMGALLALRRLASPEVARFLYDAEPLLVVEAARAIHDVPIPAAEARLAELAERSTTDEALLRRVLNANFRLGGPEHARRLARFAARADAPEKMRLEALDMLARWAKPAPRDRVLGQWRPLPARDGAAAAAALKAGLAGVVTSGTAVRNAGLKAAADLGVKEALPAVREVLRDEQQPGEARADALTALAALKDDELPEATRYALNSSAPRLRAAARGLLAKSDPAAGFTALREAALTGELVERQLALAALGDSPSDQADGLLAGLLGDLAADKLAPEARLDVLEAARRRAAAGRSGAALAAALAQVAGGWRADDPLAPHRAALYGGDAERGRRVFLEKTAASCVRCHQIDAVGGAVGPNLSKIGVDKTREYLLEAIVAPSAKIAKDFESVVLIDDEGQVFTGIVKEENDRHVRLMTAEGQVLTVPKAGIEQRKPTKSAMPEDLLKHLSPFELRDLVEFLATRK